MAKGYISTSEKLDYFNTGADIASGSIVNIGGVIAIALSDIPTNSYGAIKTDSVWSLPKITGAIAVGDPIDYDLSAAAFGSGISAAAGDVQNCGVCVGSAASGDPEVLVMLLPGKGVTA